MGHTGILVVVVRRLSRRWKVKTVGIRGHMGHFGI